MFSNYIVSFSLNEFLIEFYVLLKLHAGLGLNGFSVQ